MKSRLPFHRSALDLLRLAVGALAAAIALLAVLPAPTDFLWKVAVLVTEWGYLLALFALVPLLPGWRRSRSGRIRAALGICAVVLALTPLLRAVPVARDLPTRLERSFGSQPPRSTPAAPARAAPLVLTDLLFGIDSPPVRVGNEVYAVRGGDSLPGLTCTNPPRLPSPHRGCW